MCVIYKPTKLYHQLYRNVHYIVLLLNTVSSGSIYYIQDSRYLKLRERKPTDGIDSILVDFEELERFRAKQHKQNSVSTIQSIPV